MANQCRSKENQGNQGYNKAIQKNNIIYYAWKKIGHIAKYCKSKNPSIAHENADEKEKAKIEDIKKQHEKIWARRWDTQLAEQPIEPSVPTVEAGTTIGN